MKQSSSREDRQSNRLLFPANMENEMDILVVILLAVLWWTFAVVILVTVVNASDIDENKSLAVSIGLAVFWPLTAVLVVPFIIYQAAIASTRRIRVDLKNRGLLREFEDWLRERNAGKVVSKK